MEQGGGTYAGLLKMITSGIGGEWEGNRYIVLISNKQVMNSDMNSSDISVFDKELSIIVPMHRCILYNVDINIAKSMAVQFVVECKVLPLNVVIAWMKRQEYKHAKRN